MRADFNVGPFYFWLSFIPNELESVAESPQPPLKRGVLFASVREKASRCSFFFPLETD